MLYGALAYCVNGAEQGTHLKWNAERVDDRCGDKMAHPEREESDDECNRCNDEAMYPTLNRGQHGTGPLSRFHVHVHW